MSSRRAAARVTRAGHDELSAAEAHPDHVSAAPALHASWTMTGTDAAPIALQSKGHGHTGPQHRAKVQAPNTQRQHRHNVDRHEGSAVSAQRVEALP